MLPLYLLLRNPREEIPVWLDYIKTRRRCRFLRRELVAPPPTAPTVLIPALADWVYELKVYLMFAVALRMQGWRVVFLLSDWRSRRARRYCRAFGFSDFLYYEDFQVPPSEAEEIERVGRELLTSDLDFQAVKSWMYRGSWIGPQVLSSVSRVMFRGAPDPADPRVRGEIEKQVPVVLSGVQRGAEVMKAVRPHLCLVNEANYSVYGVIVDVAISRGIDVIQATQPWKDDAVMCKRLTARTRRSHPSSLAPESLERLMREPWTEQHELELRTEFERRYGGRWFLQARNQPRTIDMDEEGLVEELSLDPSKKRAVVFSHLLWDANLFYGEDLFQDYGDWFVHTVRAANDNPAVEWIIKLHPANLWKRAFQGVEGEYSEVALIREQVGKLAPHVKLLYPDTRVSTISLFRAADFGVTVRGTPGMEMACFGKPVFTAGTGRYSGLGFTFDSDTSGEYLKKLASLPEHRSMSDGEVLLAKRHAHSVFLLRHWRMESFRASFDLAKRGRHPLSHNLHPTVRSLQDIRDHGDLGRWAQWATTSDGVDYLESEVR